ncbi:hypothetical protein [Desulfopila aestuarii]|nr:hypothetical protein [Desulfopila aestuarii]
MKNKVTIGLLLCMAGLIFLSRNQTLLGLPLFLLGFLLMNKK